MSEGWAGAGTPTLADRVDALNARIIALECGRDAEIERLRKIEEAAKGLLRAVDKTEDHTEWFAAIGTLAQAINQQVEDTK